MGKVSELAMFVDELKKCGEMLVGISEGLADLFSGTDEEIPENKTSPRVQFEVKTETPVSEKKSVTLEEVRKVLAEKSRAGFTDEVKAILTKHGAEKLSEVDPTDYKALLAESEVIGNA